MLKCKPQASVSTAVLSSSMFLRFFIFHEILAEHMKKCVLLLGSRQRKLGLIKTQFSNNLTAG